ncbi:MAG: hypothetical protein KGL39_08755 [Patescibacteria group bacterium]|nr:hypothetical protein [Patescibacteria group bacterium]
MRTTKIHKRRIRRPYKRAAQERTNALIDARQTPPVSEGLLYKVTVETDHDRFELFTNQPYAAMMASEALADRMQARTHVMLGSIPVSNDYPKKRRRRIEPMPG